MKGFTKGKGEQKERAASTENQPTSERRNEREQEETELDSIQEGPHSGILRGQESASTTVPSYSFFSGADVEKTPSLFEQQNFFDQDVLTTTETDGILSSSIEYGKNVFVTVASSPVPEYSTEQLDQKIKEAREAEVKWNAALLSTKSSDQSGFILKELFEGMNVWEVEKELLELMREQVTRRKEEREVKIPISFGGQVLKPSELEQQKEEIALKNEETWSDAATTYEEALDLLLKKGEMVQEALAQHSTSETGNMPLIEEAMNQLHLQEQMALPVSASYPLDMPRIAPVSGEKGIAFSERSSLKELQLKAATFGKTAEGVRSQAEEAYAQATKEINKDKKQALYQKAIQLAQDTATAWRSSVEAHSVLAKSFPENKTKIYGQRLQDTWANKAIEWQQEWEGFFKKAKKEQSLDSPQKTGPSQQKKLGIEVTPQKKWRYEEDAGTASDDDTTGHRLTDLTEGDQFDMNELVKGVELEHWIEQSEAALGLSLKAKTEKESLFHQATLADAVEKNELGNTYRVIARKLQVKEDHFKNAAQAYIEKEEKKATSFEQKAVNIEASLVPLREYLNFLMAEKKKWEEEGDRIHCLEDDKASGKSVWKTQMTGSLTRREEFIDPVTRVKSTSEMAADYLMVTLKQGETEKGLLEKLKNLGYEGSRLELISKRSSLYRLYFQPKGDLAFPWLATMDELQKKVKEDNLVNECYPDYLMELCSSVGAPFLQVKEPWGLHSPFGINPPEHFFTPTAFTATPSGNPITVAIIDTGIRATHQAFTPESLFHPDVNGEINDACEYGYDALAPSIMQGFPDDMNGHGTHVAGIVAGLPQEVEKMKVNNPVTNLFEEKFIAKSSIMGVASAPRKVKLLVCKWTKAGDRTGRISDAVKCIEYAREQGATIINCSWGVVHNGGQTLSKVGLEKLKESLRNTGPLENDPSDIIAVVSAGNLKQDNDLEPTYPASLGLANFIAVAASNKKGELAKSFSNFGTQAVHMAAPGTAIISTWNTADDAYASLCGTSQAAPHVTAALVHVKRAFSSLSCDELVKHLCETADPARKQNLKVQWGSLDLAKALEPPTPEESPEWQKKTVLKKTEKSQQGVSTKNKKNTK